MRKAQDGDQAAYRDVLRAMTPVIRLLAKRQVVDESLADDVVQDVLLTIHRLRHTYDPDRPLLPWMAAITRARAIDALRRSGRFRHREVADDARLAEAVDPASPGFLSALDAEHALARMLDALPQRQRAIVEMVKLREMSLDDAAAESRMSVSAVKSVLHRAFARLRQYGNEWHV
ncbi:sigma-70 family RNA polymerase sigma factor [Sphingobium sp. YR768]|uniref:sigma-70 family RNA polymerase sigma factor n=1 Tax=Sphingobium sp. YR768 TaxID=1884365 RepID=UPI0008CAA7C5|nr:sigma-70 family RNA polymerase sigma factor [Sphingobium sp. YR768]SES09781.1 RNA polymerase sigma-70 factor, ECF subfamily [Sphingobium sp. YR768]